MKSSHDARARERELMVQLETIEGKLRVSYDQKLAEKDREVMEQVRRQLAPRTALIATCTDS